jgi:hypothetical protein
MHFMHETFQYVFYNENMLKIYEFFQLKITIQMLYINKCGMIHLRVNEERMECSGAAAFFFELDTWFMRFTY